MTVDIQSLLGDEAESLLTHESKGIPKDDLTLPGSRLRRPRLRRDATGRRRCCATCSRCSTTAGSAARATCRSCRSTRASSTRRRRRSRRTRSTSIPKNIVELAIEGGCNAVATTFGVLGLVLAAVRPPHPVHREDQPQRAADATRTSSTRSCSARSSRPTTSAPPASARRSTSAPTSRTARSIEVARGVPRRPTSSACSPCCGATCATTAFKVDGVDYHDAADLTGQANHIGVTIEADIIKQKLPTNNGGYNAVQGLRQDAARSSTTTLTTDHPIDLARWQVANCYMGRIGLINSGGESKGASDLADAVRTAVINKRAGGTAEAAHARPPSSTGCCRAGKG